MLEGWWIVGCLYRNTLFLLVVGYESNDKEKKTPTL